MAESITGHIVAGALTPHPPQLVYAENPPQNEPTSECGWETLRWGYERLRRTLEQLEIDVIVVHSPRWKTAQGHHVLGVPAFKSLLVEPNFPHLFRFQYDLTVDVELAEAIADEGQAGGLTMQMMRNPDFQVDGGTIASCQLSRPAWDLPIVVLSSSRVYFDFNNDLGDRQMVDLGRATRRAVERTGRKALLLASSSLSHRHFAREPELPEDMSQEHIYHHGQYLWDMHVLDLLRRGRTRQLMAEMPDYIEHASSECKHGSLSWLLGAMEFPAYSAEVYAYGTVIGTGNAVVGWIPPGTASEVVR